METVATKLGIDWSNIDNFLSQNDKTFLALISKTIEGQFGVVHKQERRPNTQAPVIVMTKIPFYPTM